MVSRKAWNIAESVRLPLKQQDPLKCRLSSRIHKQPLILSWSRVAAELVFAVGTVVGNLLHTINTAGNTGTDPASDKAEEGPEYVGHDWGFSCGAGRDALLTVGADHGHRPVTELHGRQVLNLCSSCRTGSDAGGHGRNRHALASCSGWRERRVHIGRWHHIRRRRVEPAGTSRLLVGGRGIRHPRHTTLLVQLWFHWRGTFFRHNVL
jgi:hypothetical protein